MLDIKSVLVVDGVGARCAEILNAHNIQVTTRAKITKERLIKEIPVSSKTVIKKLSKCIKQEAD